MLLGGCHESNYDLLFCLEYIFFSPPDGFFLKQSAGPSGVFTIFSPVCHAGQFVNRSCVCLFVAMIRIRMLKC